jgi:hypothetical protein
MDRPKETEQGQQCCLYLVIWSPFSSAWRRV